MSIGPTFPNINQNAGLQSSIVLVNHVKFSSKLLEDYRLKVLLEDKHTKYTFQSQDPQTKFVWVFWGFFKLYRNSIVRVSIFHSKRCHCDIKVKNG